MSSNSSSADGVEKRPGRPRRQTEDSEMVAAWYRFTHAVAVRMANDPSTVLPHIQAMTKYLADELNCAIFEANKGQDHYSQNEMGAMAGMKRQGIQQRIKRGSEVYAERYSVPRLAEIRRSRAVVMAAAEIPDRTGAPRERAALELVLAEQAEAAELEQAVGTDYPHGLRAVGE